MTVRRESGFSAVELLLVIAVLGVVAVVAVPRLFRARMTANESSAVASLRTTTSAQVAYSSACGNGGYAGNYTVLGTPLSPDRAAFITPDLGASDAPSKDGYQFGMGPGIGGFGPNDCVGRTTGEGYYATAVPSTPGTTGVRGFAVNAGNTVWQDLTGGAPPEPLVAGGTISVVQ